MLSHLHLLLLPKLSWLPPAVQASKITLSGGLVVILDSVEEKLMKTSG